MFHLGEKIIILDRDMGREEEIEKFGTIYNPLDLERKLGQI